MRTRHIESLTVLRGIAAWWVVVYHFRSALRLGANSPLLALLEKGFLAVDLFFILSGFVMSLNYGSGIGTGARPSTRSFLIARISRIYPLHIFILLAYVANPIALKYFSSSHGVSDRYNVAYFFASVLLVQNWGGFGELAWNIPAWSISTEFAAYLIFPLALRRIRTICTRTVDHVAAIALLLCGLSLAFWIAEQGSLGSSIEKLGLTRCVLEFLSGVVLGNLWILRGGAGWRASGAATIGGGMALALGAMAGLADYWLTPAFFLVTICLVATADAPMRRIPGWSALLYMGEISYSTYLVHYLVKDWIRFLIDSPGRREFGVYVAVVMLASAVLYRTIERPGRDLLRRWLDQATKNPIREIATRA